MSDKDGITRGEQPPQSGSGPGRMTRAMQAVHGEPVGPRRLRIGVMHGGRIVEERVIPKRETVTVGTSEKNHFVLTTRGIPARFALFQLVEGEYVLNFTDAMSGRVGGIDGVHTFEELRAAGSARPCGDHWRVPLNDSTRGKIVMGDVTLLFQFVAAPPIRLRPQLPTAARGGFVQSIDWVFTAFVLFSLLGHFGFVAFLQNTDWPFESRISAIPPELVGLIMVEEREPEVAETTTMPDPGPSEPTSEELTRDESKSEPIPSRDPKLPRRETAGGRRTEDSGNVEEQVARLGQEASALAQSLIVGALSAEGGGAWRDALAGGAPTGNSEEVLAQVRGVKPANGLQAGTLALRPGGGASGGVGDLGKLASASGGGQAREGDAFGETRPLQGSIKLDPGEDVAGSGDFDSKLVTLAVKKALRQIQSCYEQRLRHSPALQGKVTVQFTIEMSGAVSKVSATDNTTREPELETCIVGAIRRLRFHPGPEDGSVTYSYPFVFTPQH